MAKKKAKKTKKKTTRATPKKTVSKKKKVNKKSKKVVKKGKKKVSKKKTTSLSKKVKKTAKKVNKVLSKKKTPKKKASIEKDTKKIKERIAEQIIDLREEYQLKEILSSFREIDFFKSQDDECLEPGCDNPPTTLGYCRYHYIKNWDSIRLKQEIIREGKLQEFLEALIEKYPLKFIENIIDDLSDEKSFIKALKELRIIEEQSSEEEIREAEDILETDSDMAVETKDSKSYGDAYEEN